ncbi:hypothetical protein BDQ17DRAFT_1371047 [Cyathus striatus]|nr:hypothetical protein BDQ17DRAFT_1371047 [Cyathus striatus]
MPLSNSKNIRRLKLAQSIATFITELSDAIPFLPSPVKGIASTTGKILEVSLTVLRNKDDVMGLAKFSMDVTEMVIDRAQRVPILTSQLQEDIVKLEGVLNEISTIVDKFRSRNTLKRILGSNSDKEEIKRVKTRLSDMLDVFNAARAVEIQQSAAKIELSAANTGKKINKLLIVSSRKTLHSAAVRENEVDTQGKQSSRVLTVSYLTPISGPCSFVAGLKRDIR